jgi:hypothetical protein
VRRLAGDPRGAGHRCDGQSGRASANEERTQDLSLALELESRGLAQTPVVCERPLDLAGFPETLRIVRHADTFVGFRKESPVKVADATCALELKAFVSCAL